MRFPNLRPSSAASAACFLFSVIILFSATRTLAQTDVSAKPADVIPDYSSYTQSYRIPFSRRPDFSRLVGLHILASLNGGPAESYLIDTGSTGTVVAADDVPHIDPNARPGVIRYSSSGLELHGVWTTVTMTFPDSRDADGRIATAVVPVLAVREQIATGVGVNAARVRSSQHPRIHMIGVGFGRGVAAHPENNPFLCLNEMQAGTMRRGYTITRRGFTLGLTRENAGFGYVFQKLTERPVSPETTALRPGLKDWKTTPGSVTVGATTTATGAVLMDTGLTNMMLAGPIGPEPGDVPPGTNVTLHLLDGKLDYSFKVGDEKDPVAPRRVTWTKNPEKVLINTGLRALAVFDYLFDADGGYLALRPVKVR